MNQTIETTDMFRGAYFLCMGSDLTQVHITKNGRQLATFTFAGIDLVKNDKNYMNGKALVNPVQYREAINHLRDILFNKLREEKGKRYDRKRQNR